jgi:hypothetical protein
VREQEGLYKVFDSLQEAVVSLMPRRQWIPYGGLRTRALVEEFD